MSLSGRVKSSQYLLMAAMLVFAAGCVKQTVETEELPQPKPVRPFITPSRSVKPEYVEEKGMTERRKILEVYKRFWPKFESARVYFDFDKSEIRPDMRAIMDAKARFLYEYPTIRVQIEGHCDERGTIEYNIALGHRRSRSARDYLVSLGVKPSRIDTVSYGEERPADARSSEAGWARNRRAKFNIIGDIPKSLQ